jgi:hypothetical protein
MSLLVLRLYVCKQEPLDCSTTVCTTVKYCMDTQLHTLKFNFHTVTNNAAVDALVHALSIDLYIKHRIECTHPSAELLVFASETNCTFAQLALSGDTRFTLSRRID